MNNSINDCPMDFSTFNSMLVISQLWLIECDMLFVRCLTGMDKYQTN
jgi:hypothetical protein